MPLWLRDRANSSGHLLGTALSLFQLLCLLKEGRPINDFSGSFSPQNFLQPDNVHVRRSTSQSNEMCCLTLVYDLYCQ